VSDQHKRECKEHLNHCLWLPATGEGTLVWRSLKSRSPVSCWLV